MPGHYGNTTSSEVNLKVMYVDLEENIILVRGAVPGTKGSLLTIKTAKKAAKFMASDARMKKENEKRAAAMAAKEKAEKEKKKAPAKPAGGKK